MKRPLSHQTFRGKKYRIQFVNAKGLPDAVGLCDSPDSSDKGIRIYKYQTPKEMLETTIHEALHACLFDLDEAAIDETARDITRFLWRLGYRKIQDE